MNLLSLRAAHVADRLFVRELATRFPANGQWLVVFEPLPTVAATLDAGKRLSWLLSEVLVYNLSFAAGQRGLFRPQEAGGFGIDAAATRELIKHVKTLIISPVMGDKTVDSLALMQGAIASGLVTGERRVCTVHAQSPLAAAGPTIAAEADLTQWMALYDEEEATLQTALALAPASISSPVRWPVTMKG
jgi:hypothetical protein